jgi:hypothetical protein
MNYGLLVQTRPTPIVAGGSVHPSQVRPWTGSIMPLFAVIMQLLRLNAPRR